MPSGLSDLAGADSGPLATWAFAAVVVLVLILVVLFVAKRALGSSGGLNTKRGPRLTVLDVAAVDQKRRLVLVRRDEVEHLILIGGQNDLLVETGIVKTPPSLRQPQGERQKTRIEPEPITADANEPAVVPVQAIAPQPRPQAIPSVGQAVRAPSGERGPSPLRRTLPPQVAAPRQPVAAPIASAPPAATVSPPVQDEPQSAEPAIQPAPTVEPEIVAGPPTSAPERPSAPAIAPGPVKQPAVEANTQRPAAAAAPSASMVQGQNRDAEVGRADTVIRNGSATRTSAGERQVPAFLRRSENPVPPAAPAPAVTNLDGDPNIPSFQFSDPELGALPARSPARSASADNDRATQGPAFDEAVPPVRPAAIGEDRDRVTRDEAAAANGPAFRAFDAPVVGPSSPIPPQVRSEGGDRQRSAMVADAAPAVRSETPSPAEAPRVETGGDGERQPLSVRSFATVIQSRRAVAPEPIVPAPVNRVPDNRANPAVPARAPQGQSEEGRPAPSDSGAMDDFLSRELDTGLGSLDWSGESRPHAASAAPIVEPDVKPQPGTARPLTLEEEMESLLNDFDFDQQRRQ